MNTLEEVTNAIRELQDKVNKREINALDAKVKLRELQSLKRQLEKEKAEAELRELEQKKALEKAPIVADTQVSNALRDVAQAMIEKRAITLNGTGAVLVLKELWKEMVAKTPILNYISEFYGENASTVIPVWNTGNQLPVPVARGADTFTNLSDDTLGAKTLLPKAFAISYPIAKEVLKLSAPEIEGKLKEILIDLYARLIATQIFNGSGANDFTPITDGINEVNTESGKFLLSDLSKLALSIKDRTDSAAIFINPKIYSYFINDMRDTQKIYREDLVRNKMIEGVPVILTSYAPEATTDGAFIAVGGDIKNYAVAIAGELEIEPKKVVGQLGVTFDVSMWLNGAPIVPKNLWGLKLSAAGDASGIDSFYSMAFNGAGLIATANATVADSAKKGTAPVDVEVKLTGWSGKTLDAKSNLVITPDIGTNTLFFESEDEEDFTVDQNGVITFIKLGTGDLRAIIKDSGGKEITRTRIKIKTTNSLT